MFPVLAATLPQALPTRLPLTTTPFPPGDPTAPAPLDDAGAAAANGVALMFLFAFLAVALAAFVVWVWSIIDAARRDDTEWAEAGKNKVLWIVLIALIGVLASLAYLVAVRPALKDAARRTKTNLVGGFTPPPGYGHASYAHATATGLPTQAYGHQPPAQAQAQAQVPAYPAPGQGYPAPGAPQQAAAPGYPTAPTAPAPASSPDDWRGTVYQPPATPPAAD